MDEPRFNKYFQKKFEEKEKLELKKIDYIIALLEKKKEKLELKKIDYIIALLENISRHLSS
jgi:hypothetical protein